MQSDKKDLKKRIREEMTVDYSSVLEENFDLAKQFIRLTEDGEVEVRVKEKVTGEEAILLYLLGKKYAKEGGYTLTDEVGNEEFLGNLGMPEGSLLPWLKSLRDRNRIKRIKRERYVYHVIPIGLVGETLKLIDEKLQEAQE